MKFWRALERLAGGAVLLEWKRELGDDFQPARPFLRLSQELAETIPCANVIGCGFPHHVEPAGPGRWFGVHHGDDWCEPIPLTREDLTVYELDMPTLLRTMASTLNLSTPSMRVDWRVKAHFVGIHPGTSAKVFLMFPGDPASMAREVERLICANNDAFMLLTPTGAHCTPEVESALERQGSVHVAASVLLQWNGKSTLTRVAQGEAVFEKFASAAVAARGRFAKTTEQLARGVEAMLGQNNGAGATEKRSKSEATAPDYALKKEHGVWSITFEGKSFHLKHERGMDYVSYLLLNPPEEPLHGTELAHLVHGDAVVENQRSVGLDDAEIRDAMAARLRECRSILDDPDASEVEKAEAERQRDEIEAWAKKHLRGTEEAPEKQVRAIRQSLRRLLEGLSGATDEKKRPNQGIRKFGAHLEKYLWFPSVRRRRRGSAGRFSYEPPPGVVWKR